jgi:REP element-mobilizing transposase RayT
MNIFHVVWVTHNSRISERMVTFGVKRGEPVSLSNDLECEVSSYILQIAQENRVTVLAYNICRDHVHMIIVCLLAELATIVAKLKGKSSVLFKKARAIEGAYHLWAQKYYASEILNDKQLEKVMNYIIYNRQKHNLPVNKGLQPLVSQMVTLLSNIFNQEEKNKFAGSGA